MAGILKIVLTGPESSGKSELARHLSQHFSIPFVPEFARIYLEREGPEYNFELVSKLARWHWEFQQEHIRKAKEVIILDTDLINFEIWQKMEFGKVDPWITDHIKEESDHRYLITYPDIPWVEDPLRANKYDRKILFDLHRRAVESRNRWLETVHGQGALRFTNAEKHFRRMLSDVDY